MRLIRQTTELLLADNARADVAARSLSETGAWHGVVALAETWKVIPQLLNRVQHLGTTLSAKDTVSLRRTFLEMHGYSASRLAKTITALRALEHASISVVAFKGVASMAVLYEGPKHRTIGDGDLLIHREDLPGALACLEAKGFARKGEETLAQYLEFVKNAPRFAGNEAIALSCDDGEIDLHWEIAGSGLDPDGIIKRAVTAHLMGSAIPVVDAKDGFLLTVHHAVREDLSIESVCRDLLDARLWCEHMEQHGQLEAGMAWAVESGSQVAALAVTSLLSSFDGATAAARAASVLNSQMSRMDRQSASSLAELFHYQIEHGRLGKDVFYLVHSRPLGQILKGLIKDWSGYRKSMQTLDKHLTQEQPLRDRFAALARSVPNRKGLKLARELARVRYRTAQRKRLI
jgi:hypothetical protein